MLSKAHGVASLTLHAALVFADPAVSVATVVAAPPADGVLIELEGDYPELAFVDAGSSGATGRVALIKPLDEPTLHLQGGAIVRGASDTDVRQCGYGTAPALPTSTTFSPTFALSPGSSQPATIVFGRAPANPADERRVALQISPDGRTLTVYGGTIIIDGADLKAQCAPPPSPPPTVPPPSTPPSPTTYLTMGSSGASCTDTCAARTDGRTDCILGAYGDNTASWVPTMEGGQAAWDAALASADNNDPNVALFVLAGHATAYAHTQRADGCGSAKPYLSSSSVQENMMQDYITHNVCTSATMPTCDASVAGGRRICLCGPPG